MDHTHRKNPTLDSMRGEMRIKTALPAILILLTIYLVFGFARPAEAGQLGRLGGHLQVYGEPHEEDTPLYINVVPLIYEHPLASRMTLKVGTILALRFADGVSLGNVGGKVGLPLYLSLIEESRMRGFFAGPLVQVSRNLHTREVVISSAIDLGYSFYLGERLSMSLGVEAGVSTFLLEGQVANRPHIGPGLYLYF
jgi:hypothetical protein